jgi:hypothetical protein
MGDNLSLPPYQSTKRQPEDKRELGWTKPCVQRGLDGGAGIF